MIRLAKDTGANFVKFQCYTPESLTINCDTEFFKVHDKHSPWFNMSLWEIYEKSYTPKEWFPQLFEECRRVGIEAIVTPYCLDDLNYLENVDCPNYKVSAFESVDASFVKSVANTGKRVFVSVGQLSIEEVNYLWIVVKEKNPDSILMHSVSKYPPLLRECNFPRMQALSVLTNGNFGFSDHSLDEWSTLTAISYGATYIEKHFKNCEDCIDAHFSLNEWELGELIKLSKDYHSAINSKTSDDKSYTRSIFAIADIKKGEEFSSDNIKIIRPGIGLHPKHFVGLCGKKSNRDIKRGYPIIDRDLQNFEN